MRVDRFLAKPFMMNDLLAAIQDLLPSRFFVPPPVPGSMRANETRTGL
jgi:DNA-binding response OmpR family regulator